MALPADHGALPRWDVADLPAPLPFSPRNLLKVIGPGAVHSYDLKIGADGLRGLGLLRDETTNNRLPGVDRDHAPLHLALGYELDRLPSFAAPAPVIPDIASTTTLSRSIASASGASASSTAVA